MNWQGAYKIAETLCKKKLWQKNVCGLTEMGSMAWRREQSQAEAERGGRQASEAEMYICKVLNGFKYNPMNNPFTCELTHEQQVMNSGGKCLGCSSDTEPIVGMEPIDGPDGTPVAVAYSLEGYERYCHGCATQLYAFLPFEQEPTITDDELPF